MQLSVIILNYNVRYFLEQCLLSVQKSLQEIDSEIIVVDNASFDDSCQMVEQLFPDVLLIKNNENTGFPKGNNIGVSKARGKYICILNPDTVVSEDTFQKLLEFVKDKKNIGITGCKLIDGTGNFLPESKRNVPTPKVSLLKMLGKSEKYYASQLNENQTGKASVFVGAFMFVEKSKYELLGGFDQNFFMYGEDIDLSYRFEKQGFENYYFSDTTIIHYKGESTGKDNVYIKRFYGAMQIFYKKHFKTNFLFDFFIFIGIRFFSTVNLFRSKNSSEITPENYILISDSEILRQQISQKLLKNLVLIKDHKNHKFKELDSKNTEIIFDSSFIQNKEIMAFIEKYNNQGFTFKIRPENTNFIIGSNSKNDKGKIIVFDSQSQF